MSGKILVVDDDPRTREPLAELLRLQGFTVITAGDGISALAEFERTQPDLVLLDVMMPGLNGFEVCKHIKGDPNTRLTPVVMVTGLEGTEDRVRGFEAGADDFLIKPIDPTEMRARVSSLRRQKSYTDELEQSENVIFALAESIEGKDPYTKGHCDRLSDFSVQLGKRVGMLEEEIVALRRAGIVHDIGKVAVPDVILLKPSRLTAEEWEIMRQHPVNGERICMPLKSFRMVLPIIRHHHEKLDGSGYPDGLRGQNIPLTARVLQIADVYDALTTERPYKPALTPVQALARMEEETALGWWDTALVLEFRKLLDSFPEEKELIKARNSAGFRLDL